MTPYAVTASWLAEHLADPAVVIVDCRFDLMDITRGQREYDQGHIPRAYYLDLEQDLSSPRQERGGRHPLPDPEKLAARLNQMGITPDTLVVAYDDSRFAYAARCWWLLRWLGHDRAAVLDGGYRAYVEAGYPTTPEVPSPRPGNFQPHPHSQWVVDRTGVMAAQADPQTVIVDAREPRRYRGEIEPIDPIAGHIPGAVNYPWQAISDAQGRLKSVAELQAHWQPLAEAEQIIVYCGSGVTACVDILGLAIAGLHQTKLYAGSWSDWCSYLAAPHDRSL
ncbi:MULTISPECIES: sulfurtransferase [unclassified Thermosynechococcus]|uniref:sulfurtransferase n=1 Tax=unclassified Thermosynechococcus TaxID=2622553 RepID=UPI002873D888|nr:MULTISPECIES: sulfurtransferase [unclassified Thermosynechococcus]WNC32064.1 sulfurtransferase [Thermosynechococcus sp. PKX95]WNC34593.1 sulfurtransferase [Thermosynechococcus sp. PKX91]WNC37111.1 sulfurtransferase [Thermosynechococcus sp. WL11]WNC39632.1 sulfurtransferase [Thermosynechococcus sp. WL17]WNC42153.1 sulfurtransferase [Thermosynechococcus sp. WL15]